MVQYKVGEKAVIDASVENMSVNCIKLDDLAILETNSAGIHSS